MKVLVVNGQNYFFPEESDSPPWGSLVTDWATAVTGVLDEVVGTGDIVETSAGINNNVSSATNVAGLTFSTAAVRGAIVDYSIYRVTTSTGATELVEVGNMYLGFKNTANSWDIVVVGGNTAGVTFSITNTGQVQYVSTNITGLNYSGIIKFRARALTQ